MNELMVERCPTLEELLQAGESELSPEAHATVLQHLQQCAICQARDRHALRTLRDINGYLAGAFGEERQHARQHEFSVGVHKLKQALIHRSIGWPWRRWLPMAALVPVFIVALLLSRTGTVVLQADQLLERAVQAEQQRPRGAIQRVRVRLLSPNAMAIPPRATASFTIVQELTDGVAPVGPLSTTSVPGTGRGGTAVALTSVPMSLAHRLASHKFDWRRPMDVARFHAWRGTLAHKQDQVIALAGSPLVVLRTTTADDTDLVEAEITVQRDDFHVVRAAFVFEGVGRLEIEELAQWVRRTASPAPVVPAEPVALERLAQDTLARAELSTRLLLAQTGLDLPGTLRVSHDAALVHVEGTWPSAAQRRALNGRLLALPHVSVDLRVADAEADDAVGGRAIALREGSPVAAFLERVFIDPHERELFLPELRRLTTTVRQRMGVMRELAQRYPEAEVRAFSPEARATLQQLLEWQYQQLRADLNGLDARVRVLSVGSESRALPAATLPADWAHCTEAGLTEALAFDRTVQKLLAQQDLPSVKQERDRGQTPLSQTFRAMWEAVVGPRPSHAARAES